MFDFFQGEHELRQKLMNARHELEKMKNVKAELLDLLNMAYQERDEARCQLQKLMNPLQNVFDTHQNQGHFNTHSSSLEGGDSDVFN